MDYISRFGLEFNPFIKGGNESLVETKEYQETSKLANAFVR